jgi:hypothetical protein
MKDPYASHIKYYVMSCNLHQNIENLKFGIDSSIIDNTHKNSKEVKLKKI